jgi:hypothetical protein
MSEPATIPQETETARLFKMMWPNFEANAKDHLELADAFPDEPIIQQYTARVRIGMKADIEAFLTERQIAVHRICHLNGSELEMILLQATSYPQFAILAVDGLVSDDITVGLLLRVMNGQRALLEPGCFGQSYFPEDFLEKLTTTCEKAGIKAIYFPDGDRFIPELHGALTIILHHEDLGAAGVDARRALDGFKGAILEADALYPDSDSELSVNWK